MTTKKLLLAFLIAMIVVITGALFKLMHWPGSEIMLIIGMLSQAAVIILFIISILKDKNK